MKKAILYSLLAITVLFGCRKSDNPKLPDMTRVPVPKIAIAASSEATIDVAKGPALFKGKFDVGLLFPGDIPPQKLDIVVIKNGNKTVIKTVKADVTTLPATIEVSGAELISLFGSPIIAGNFFDIGADITLPSGQKLQAFPAIGTQFAGGTANIPGSSTSIRYLAK